MDTTPPTPSSVPNTPTCWKCGYNLTGLQVTDLCPECATPIWSTPAGAPTQPIAQLNPEAMTWGLVALILFFTCLGPLAGLVAIPAVVKGRAAKALVSTGRYPAHLASNARTGLILGWITIGLSIGALCLYGFIFLIGGF